MKYLRMFHGKKLPIGLTNRREFEREAKHKDALASIAANRSGLSKFDITDKNSNERVQRGQSSRYKVQEIIVPNSVESPSGLARLIAPLSKDAFFLNQDQQAEPILFKGHRDRYSSIITFTDLNEIVSHRNLNSPQLRIFYEGEYIEPSMLIRANHGIGSRFTNRHLRLDDRKLLNFLRAGATMVVDNVHTLHEPIDQLVQQIELDVGTLVNVNMYCSWRSAQGFQTHWDDHDVFVVQVQGRKEWSIYKPTRKYPMQSDSSPNDEPDSEPSWTQMVSSGDVLYIPRGWWHHARIREDDDDVGSIHLTVHLRSFTGHDVLAWLAGKFTERSEFFRKNVPWTNADGVRDSYFKSFGQLVTKYLDQPDLGELFIKDTKTYVSNSVPVQIEDRMHLWQSKDWENYVLELANHQLASLEYSDDQSTFELHADGVVHTLDLDCVDLVQELLKHGNMRVSELLNFAPDRFDRKFILEFTAQLARENIVIAYRRDSQ